MADKISLKQDRELSPKSALFVLFIFSLIVNLYLQLSNSLDILATLSWPFSHFSAFFLSLTVVFVMAVLLFAFFKSLRISFLLVFLPLFLLASTSLIKKQKLGQPLFFGDFHAAHETLHIVGPILRNSWGFLSLAVAGLLLLAWLAFKIPQVRDYSAKKRIVSSFISVVFLLLILLANNPVHEFLFKKTFTIQNLNAEASLIEQGTLIHFFLQGTQGQLNIPIGYSDEFAKKLSETLRQLTTPTEFEKPDVFVVMSESLFDPLILKGIHWKTDPLAFTRSLAGTASFNIAVVPTFGGKTANSEFEFLTSHSIRFLPEGTIPYKSLIPKNASSLVKNFKENGYRTIAVHPFVPEFWNREQVYSSFGFDQFLSLSNFVEPQKRGQFVTDNALFGFLQKSLKNQTGPEFYFIVTIQNHMPYDFDAFDMSNLLFDPEGLSDSEKVVLNSYSNLLVQSDAFHRNLVAFLQKRNRPTLLIIFGDHLPTLMNDFGVYKGRIVKSSTPQEWTPEELLSIYTTPLVFWSNFQFPPEIEPLALPLLGPRVLKKLGFPLTPYQNFLMQMSDQLRIVHPLLPPPEEENVQRQLHDYRILQHALMTGKLQY
ncbi:MAG: LTA synthase family protein [Pseudobdellovibrionaceae bacterium]